MSCVTLKENDECFLCHSNNETLIQWDSNLMDGLESNEVKYEKVLNILQFEHSLPKVSSIQENCPNKWCERCQEAFSQLWDFHELIQSIRNEMKEIVLKISHANSLNAPQKISPKIEVQALEEEPHQPFSDGDGDDNDDASKEKVEEMETKSIENDVEVIELEAEDQEMEMVIKSVRSVPTDIQNLVDLQTKTNETEEPEVVDLSEEEKPEEEYVLRIPEKGSIQPQITNMLTLQIESQLPSQSTSSIIILPLRGNESKGESSSVGVISNILPVYTCDVCGSKFRHKFNLTKHKKIFHDPTKLQFKCDTCEKICSNYHNLKRHMQVHSSGGERCQSEEKDTLKCTKCDKYFTTVGSLSYHEKREHDKNGYISDKNQVNCETCNMPFTSKRNLYNHKRRVHEKHHVHKCEFCGKGFFEKRRFEKHLNTHKTPILNNTIHYNEDDNNDDDESNSATDETPVSFKFEMEEAEEFNIS